MEGGERRERKEASEGCSRQARDLCRCAAVLREQLSPSGGVRDEPTTGGESEACVCACVCVREVLLVACLVNCLAASAVR